MIVGRLDRYVARSFLWTYFVTLVFFLGLFLIMDLFAGLDDVLKAPGRMGGWDVLLCVLGLYGSGLPFMFAQVAPFVTVTAAVVTVVRLRRTDELVPMVAAGRSARRVLLPIFLIAAAISVLLLVAQEHVLPDLAAAHRRFGRTLKGRDASLFDKLPHLVDESGTAFLCDAYDADEHVLIGVRAPRYVAGDRRWSLQADRLVWRTGHEGEGWYAVNGRLDEVGQEVAPGPVTSGRAIGAEERVMSLKPREIDVLVDESRGLGMTSAQLRRLIRRHPGRIGLRLHLHTRRAFAVANVVLLLIGLPFAFQGSGRSTIVGAGLCIFICAAYFAVDTLTRDAAVRGALHPIVAAWTPVVLFAGVGAVLFDGLKT
jgi:lipopolysaccharide export system permease protein